MEKFTVGSVLGTGLGIWVKNLVPFLFLTALIYAPLVIWGISLVRGDFVWEAQRDTFESVVAFEPLAHIFLAAALTYGVVMELRGERASLGACIATGLARFFPTLGVALLCGLAIVGGLFAFVVPGVIMYCMLYVATQVAVLERPGLLGALKRSRALTRGHMLRIFGLTLVLLIADMFSRGFLEGAMVDPDVPAGEHGLGVYQRYVYAELARLVVMGSIYAVMSAVAYHQLRGEKEGTTARELARVFE